MIKFQSILHALQHYRSTDNWLPIGMINGTSKCKSTQVRSAYNSVYQSVWYSIVVLYGSTLMSKLWDATVAEVAPLSNPTLSGKKPSACPRELSHILSWVRVLPMGQDAHHFQHGIVSNTVSIMLDQAEERRQEIWTRTSCTQIPGKIPRHHGIGVWFSQF